MVIFKELPELTQTSDSNCGLYTILLGFVPFMLGAFPISLPPPKQLLAR
jgi:hypothetical protein